MIRQIWRGLQKPEHAPWRGDQFKLESQSTSAALDHKRPLYNVATVGK
jgi:hypothetical protein